MKREKSSNSAHKIIEPDEPLGDSIDFSREAINKSMEAGGEKARQVLG